VGHGSRSRCSDNGAYTPGLLIAPRRQHSARTLFVSIFPWGFDSLFFFFHLVSTLCWSPRPYLACWLVPCDRVCVLSGVSAGAPMALRFLLVVVNGCWVCFFAVLCRFGGDRCDGESSGGAPGSSVAEVGARRESKIVVCRTCCAPPDVWRSRSAELEGGRDRGSEASWGSAADRVRRSGCIFAFQSQEAKTTWVRFAGGARGNPRVSTCSWPAAA